MSFTTTDVWNGVRRIHTNVIEDDVVNYLNEIRPEAARLLRLREVSQSVNLTAETREYTVTRPMLGALSVEYVRSATDMKVLEPTSLDDKDIVTPNWKNVQSGEPREYYFYTDDTASDSNLKIGLFPMPDTTTAAGYPSLRIRYLDINVLTSGATIYDDLAAGKSYYVQEVAYRYSRDRGLDDLEVRKFARDEAYMIEEAHVKGRQRKNQSLRLRCTTRRPSGVT